MPRSAMVWSNTSSRSSRWLPPMISPIPGANTSISGTARHHRLSAPTSSLSAWFGVLRQQSIHDFRPVPEARCLQSGESVGEVDQSAPGAQVQYTQSTRRRETQLSCNGDAGAIVDEDQVGA